MSSEKYTRVWVQCPMQIWIGLVCHAVLWTEKLVHFQTHTLMEPDTPPYRAKTVVVCQIKYYIIIQNPCAVKNMLLACEKGFLLHRVNLLIVRLILWLMSISLCGFSAYITLTVAELSFWHFPWTPQYRTENVFIWVYTNMLLFI